MVKTIKKMKNTFNLFVIALMSTTTFYAQEVVLDWENPEIFAVNLEKQGLLRYLTQMRMPQLSICMKNPPIINH